MTATAIPYSLWVVGDSLAAGATVATWPDLSGNGHDLIQVAPANRPHAVANAVNGRTAVRFDQLAPSILTSTFSFGRVFSVVLALKQITIGAGAANDVIFDGISPASAALVDDNSPHTYIYQGSVMGFAGNIAAGAYAVVTAIFNGALSSIWQNGVQLAAGDAGSSAADPGGLTLGALGGGTRPTNIEVAELRLCKWALSPSDRAAIEANLRAEYAI